VKPEAQAAEGSLDAPEVTSEGASPRLFNWKISVQFLPRP